MKSQLTLQPVDLINSVATSPAQLQACEQRQCLALLPLDCQEKVQIQVVISEKDGKHIAWLTHHNLIRECKVPLLAPK